MNRSVSSDSPILLELYPNPASTEINIVILAPEDEKVIIEQVDIYGRILSKEVKSISEGKTINPIDIKTLCSGIYGVKVTFTSDNSSVFRRFIKK